MANGLVVELFERSASIDFLLQGTQQSDEGAADTVAETLGDLPLALAQAAAYVRATGISLASYHELFTTHRQTLLEHHASSIDSPEPVATTWEMAFQKLQETTPVAVDLLNLFAFLAPDAIPQRLLTDGQQFLPEALAVAVADPSAFYGVRAALLSYSLLEITDNVFTIHRLVQAVIRARLSENERAKWAGAAVTLIQGVYPYNVEEDRDLWPICADLLPHGLIAGEHAEQLGLIGRSAGSKNQRLDKQDDREIPLNDVFGILLLRIGAYLQLRDQLDESRTCFEWALDCFAQIHGPAHDFISVTTNGIGDVLQALNELEGMREYFEYARRSDTAVYRHALRHPSAVVRSQFQFQHFLRYDEAHYGPDHPNVAITLTNIGHMLREESDLEEAREHFERALKIDEAAYESEHQQAAIRLNNLGRVLRELGDLAGARQCYERALQIDTAVYGSEHPNMSVRLNNLGRLLQDEGDQSSAHTHYKQALDIFHQFYGDEHPKTQTVQANLDALEAAE